MTIGGGAVVDVSPRYHRRLQAPILENLERLSQGAPEELVLAALQRRGGNRGTTSSKAAPRFQGYELVELAKQCNLASDVTLQTLTTLLSERRVHQIGAEGAERTEKAEGLWFAQPVWEQIVEETRHMLSDYHQHYPLRSGLSKEEWRTRSGLSPKVATLIFPVLQAEGYIESVTGSATTSASSGSLIRLPGFEPHFKQEQQQQVERLLRLFGENPLAPPGRAEAEESVGSEIVAALIEQGRLVKLNDNILFLKETCDQAIIKLVHYLRIHQTMTAAEARDVLGATRKYVLPLLEYMDMLRITRRVGDERVAGLAAERW